VAGGRERRRRNRKRRRREPRREGEIKEGRGGRAWKTDIEKEEERNKGTERLKQQTCRERGTSRGKG